MFLRGRPRQCRKHCLALLSVSGTVHARVLSVRSDGAQYTLLRVLILLQSAAVLRMRQSVNTPLVSCCCSISVHCQTPLVRLHVTKTGHQAKMFPLYDSVQSQNVILESVARVVPELVARVRLIVLSLEHRNFSPI